MITCTEPIHRAFYLARINKNDGRRDEDILDEGRKEMGTHEVYIFTAQVVNGVTRDFFKKRDESRFWV